MNITYDSHYAQYPILTNNQQSHGCYIDILEKIHALLTHMTSKHSKVLFIRFDVRFPQDQTYPQDNVLFSKFIANFIKYYERQGLDPAYIWAREHDEGLNHHYHCVLLLDGQKVQAYYPILQHAEQMWSNILQVPTQGLIHFCDCDYYGNLQKNGLMIRHDKYAEPEQMEKCFQWASYLAKVSTKERHLHGMRMFGTSRIYIG